MKAIYIFFALAASTLPAQEVIGPIRVNAGGSSYTDAAGQIWRADTGYSGTTTVNTTTNSMAGVADPTLYQSQRAATSSSP